MARSARVLALLVAAFLAAARVEAEERVSFPSLDGAANAPVVLTGLWFPVARSCATYSTPTCLGCSAETSRMLRNPRSASVRASVSTACALFH